MIVSTTERLPDSRGETHLDQPPDDPLEQSAAFGLRKPDLDYRAAFKPRVGHDDVLGRRLRGRLRRLLRERAGRAARHERPPAVLGALAVLLTVMGKVARVIAGTHPWR